MDARLGRQLAGDPHVHALLMIDLVREARAQPPHRQRAQRVERDVAEVEQAREADHDVQAERHHDVGERSRARVHLVAGRLEEQREEDDQRQDECLRRPAEIAVAPEWLAECGPRTANALDRSGSGAHPASLVSSPSRPWGLKTMISTR